MAKKETIRKPFNFQGGSELIDLTEQQVEKRYDAIENGAAQEPAQSKRASELQPKEPTKGIQTDVPMSLYLRLIAMKYRRGESICSMMIQALEYWLTAMEAEQ